MSPVDTAIIIQARMESTRLPGKSLMSVAGVPLIKRCYQQCSKSSINKVIVATASTEQDKVLYEYLCQEKILAFQGDSDNLVKRYYDAACHYSIKNIIRITGDNPLIAPDIIDRVWQLYLESGADYATTRYWNGREFKSHLTKGVAVDVFAITSLEAMLASSLSKQEMEHIVYYFVDSQRHFKIAELKEKNKCPYDLSIDTADDLARIEKIIRHFEKLQIEFCYSNYCMKIKEALE